MWDFPIILKKGQHPTFWSIFYILDSGRHNVAEKVAGVGMNEVILFLVNPLRNMVALCCIVGCGWGEAFYFAKMIVLDYSAFLEDIVHEEMFLCLWIIVTHLYEQSYISPNQIQCYRCGSKNLSVLCKSIKGSPIPRRLHLGYFFLHLLPPNSTPLPSPAIVSVECID